MTTINVRVVNSNNGTPSSTEIKSCQSYPKETILETLERYDVLVQFHCRDGFCGACRSTLDKGSVTYVTDPLAFIDDDEFLPCCTKPQGDIDISIV